MWLKGGKEPCNLLNVFPSWCFVFQGAAQQVMPKTEPRGLSKADCNRIFFYFKAQSEPSRAHRLTCTVSAGLREPSSGESDSLVSVVSLETPAEHQQIFGHAYIWTAVFGKEWNTNQVIILF